MSLAAPVPANWLYDFGDVTATSLGTAVSGLEAKINAARSAAITMIQSGSYGGTGATYRVTVRADATQPSGYSVNIALTT